MKKASTKAADDLCPEYDLKKLFKGAERGKYAKAYQSGTNLILLQTDVHKEFPSDEAVNAALRLVIQLRKVGGPNK